MSSDYQKQLEEQIHRELRDLPELSAPETLMSRVMAVVESREVLPWYRQPWIQWPVVPRAAALAGLLGLFALVTFVFWKISVAEVLPAVHQITTRSASGFEMVWNTLNALLEAGMLVAKHLGTGFLIACLVVSAFSYLACIGLGTMVARFAFARR